MEDKIKKELKLLEKALSEKIDFMKQLQATFGQAEKDVVKLEGAIEALKKILDDKID